MLHLHTNSATATTCAAATTATFWGNIICGSTNNGNRHHQQQRRRRRLQVWVICVILVMGYPIIQLSSSPSLPSSSISTKDIKKSKTIKEEATIPIVIQLYNNKNSKRFKSNQKQNKANSGHSSTPDYGGLDLSFPTKREISKMEYNYNMSLWDGYQDTEIYKHYEFASKTKCNNVNWRYLYYPNCNFFHELHSLDDDQNFNDGGDRSSNNVQYINSGYYRDVFSFNQIIPGSSNVKIEGETINTPTTTHDMMALKRLRLVHNTTRENILEITTEALVMERLTPSPRIMNIYGHCSTTVATEFVENEIEDKIVPYGGFDVVNIAELRKKEVHESKSAKDVEKNKNRLKNKAHTTEQEMVDNPLLLNPSQNNLGPSEKLNLAFEMASSIADLHGFKDGIIVHDDIQLRQWLRSSIDGRLILGDFNRARIMRWNDVDQKYCKFRTGDGECRL